jgi:sulfide:quinone oxidoreductase
MAVFDVVIAGAGIAGVEGLLRLRRIAGDDVRITVISPAAEFVYRPLAVLEPFSRDTLRCYPLAPLIAQTGATHVRDRLQRVDPAFRVVVTESGREIGYDGLLVAVGAGQSNPYAHSALFTDRNRGETFASIVADLEAGRVASLAFVVSNWPVWPLALYELALLTAHHARERDIAVQLTFVTAEPRPLKAFGQAAGEVMERLLDDAGIALRVGVLADVPEPGRLRLGQATLYADRIVSLPRVIGPSVSGLPAAIGWFTPIDDYCRVPDTEGRVFAAGDATDSPIKHGGLGAQQADIAAAGIAHLAGLAPRPEPLRPLIRGILLTGGSPLYLTARVVDGLGWSSEVCDRPPWPDDGKVVAEELGPYLAGLGGVSDRRYFGGA